jgi:hypothetical protein
MHSCGAVTLLLDYLIKSIVRIRSIIIYFNYYTFYFIWIYIGVPCSSSSIELYAISEACGRGSFNVTRCIYFFLSSQLPKSLLLRIRIRYYKLRSVIPN